MINGNRIRELRKAKHWSQAELSRRSGVSQPTIAEIETGDQKSSRALPRIASALEVDVSELDPEYVSTSITSLLPEVARTAFETMLEALIPTYKPQERGVLAEIFLDLAQMAPDGEIGLSLRDQMRLLARLPIRQFLRSRPASVS